MPWRLGDLLVLYVMWVAGLVLVLLGWFGASGSVELNSQVRWANVGAAGVIVFGAGSLFWLLQGRRAVGELRRAIRVRLTADAQPPPPVDAPPATGDGGALVATDDMRLYHRPSCPLAAGKPVRPATAAQHRRSGRQPCGVCSAGEVGGA